MQPTTLSGEPKQLVYNPEDRDWSAFYGEHLIGVYKRPSLARQALDAYAYDGLKCGTLPAPVVQNNPHLSTEPIDDPLTLYSAGGPRCGLPLAAASLDAALAHFCATCDQPKVQERAQRARALLNDPDRWTIQPAGTVQIIGKSDTYLVTDEACQTLAGAECPDQKYRTGVTGGQCYHTIARELLRLAQIIEHGAAVPDDPPALPELAFVCLPGRLFGLALGIVYLTQQPVIWQLADGQLTLRACADRPLAEVRLACVDGAGVVAAEVAPTDVAMLWQLVKPIAKQLESIQIFVDRTDGQINLAADGLSATAPGRVLP